MDEIKSAPERNKMSREKPSQKIVRVDPFESGQSRRRVDIGAMKPPCRVCVSKHFSRPKSEKLSNCIIKYSKFGCLSRPSVLSMPQTASYHSCFHDALIIIPFDRSFQLCNTFFLYENCFNLVFGDFL